MKIVTYSANGQAYRLGIYLDETRIVDPQTAYAERLASEGQLRAEAIAEALLPADPTAFLENGESGRQAAEQALAYASHHPSSSAIYQLSEVRIGPPLLRPNKIICVGLNYKDHILEMKREFPAHPVIFAKYATAIAEPNGEFPLQSQKTQKLDYEAELAFVIGKKGKDIAKADAMNYVAGYTVVNDITARDMQKRTIQWLQGKTLDKSLPMGPCLVTKDELADPHALDISLTVNGELRQSSNTKQLLFNIPDLVAFLSGIMTFEPGDVVCTGTPGGVGEAQGLFLKDGDVVRVTIGGIGSIETRIVEEEVRQ